MVTARGRDQPVCGYKDNVQQCSPLLCLRHVCPAHPNAHCRVNPCGETCSVDFFDEFNQRVDCFRGEDNY